MQNTSSQTPPPTPESLPIMASPSALRPAIIGQFFAVVLIWSFTPLAAVLTVKEVHWAWGLFLRFSLALLAALCMLRLFKIKWPFSLQACLSYLAGAVGLFGSMTLCYMGAVYVPSAVISIIYGFAPLFSGLICILFFKHPWFSRQQFLGLLLAMIGMVLALGIGISELKFHTVGIILEFSAVLLYVISALAVTKLSSQIHPIAQMAGSTLFSWIGYLILLPFFNHMPIWNQLSPITWSAIVYSAVFSSVVAMVCYYSLIQHIKTHTLMLITIITPVLATLWGTWLNQEQLGHYFFIGLTLLCLGLYLYLPTRK